MPSDVGLHLPNGALRMNMHYNNLQGSTDGPDNSGLEICVLKKQNFRPKTAATATNLSQFLISLPPKTMDMEVTGNCTVGGTQPVTIISASPHAHKLAHRMRFTVKRASGETVVMHEGDFNFEEQTSYPLKMPVEVKSGDTITTTCIFSNPGNTTVTFGENTENEMCFNFAVYYPMGALSCGGGGGFPGL
jgi:alpha-glucosidase (family GH31 glycosyl hydrolase)